MTDAGLAHLKPLTNLTKLELYHTKVTAVGIADLRRALPKCEIGWSDPERDKFQRFR